MLTISENFWNEIKNIIPVKKTKVGRSQKDARTTLSGIFYVMKTVCQWNELLDYYGKPTTVHGRFRNWVKEEVFEKILELSKEFAIRHFGPPQCFFSDTISSKAPLARFGRKNPTDRAKNGIKKGIDRYE